MGVGVVVGASFAVVGVGVVDGAFFAFFFDGSSAPAAADPSDGPFFDSELLVKGDNDLRLLGRLFSVATREGTVAAVVEVSAERGVGIVAIRGVGIVAERGVGIVAATAGFRDNLIS